MDRTEATPRAETGNEGISASLSSVLARRWRLLSGLPIMAALAGVGASYLITPVFTARTSFLPPQQQQSPAASALASLGALSGLVGGAIGRAPADQYVTLLQSITVADRLIDRFELLKVYDKDLRVDARKVLTRNTQAVAGKKDGLIVVQVDDESPSRAAALANAYVEELRLLTNQLALTEAQQRRIFFEAQMKNTRDRLAAAQRELLASGFSLDSLKAEPKAAAEGYAKMRAEVTSAQARLDAMRRGLTDAAPEVQQAEAAVTVLRAQLARAEGESSASSRTDYVGKYREFKYQEALFEQFSRQYELARLDESREGLLQVVDPAQPPEKKSWPKRSWMAAGGLVFGLIAALVWVLVRADTERAASASQRGSTAAARDRS